MSEIDSNSAITGVLFAAEENDRVLLGKTYSEKDLNKAVEEVLKGESVYAAAKRYNIPKTTLHSHKDGKITEKRGRKSIFEVEVEREIAGWIFKCADRGAPKTKAQVMHAATLVRRKIYGDNTAIKVSAKWYQSFLQRNPDISLRVAQAVTRSSACVTEIDIRRWFSTVHHYLAKEDLLHLMDQPARFINLDETGFEFNPTPGKFLGRKGTKNLNYVETGHPSERVSVMYTFGADGHSYSPQMIVKKSVSAEKLREMSLASIGKQIFITLPKNL